MAYTVAVTGAGGFVASEVVKQLLEKGYNVNGTVRDPEDASKVGHLLKLAEALPGEQQAALRRLQAVTHPLHVSAAATTSHISAGKLKLMQADLMSPGSFHEAFAGCRYIFHVASPFFIDAEDAQRDLVDVAVDGTRNVMLAAAQTAGSHLKRVVLTSSCAAVKGMRDSFPPDGGDAFNEDFWNTSSTVEGGEAYWVSKTQAEKLAWQIAEQHGLDLVTILPEFVMGPLISARADSTSTGFMKTWVEGGSHKGSPVFADVRDVAKAHILAAEVPTASGRFIVANAKPTAPQEIVAWLRERFPGSTFADPVPEESDNQPAKMDNSKVQRELGLAITPVRSTVVDMAQCMLQLGLATLK